MLDAESFETEFRLVVRYMDVNPFDQRQMAEAAHSLDFDEFAEFCSEVSEDIYVIKAKEWYSETDQ
jgi:hypothetical protein